MAYGELRYHNGAFDKVACNSHQIKDINLSIVIDIRSCVLWRLLSKVLTDDDNIEEIYNAIVIDIPLCRRLWGHICPKAS